MDAYRKAMTGKNTTVVLGPEGEFFNYLNSPHAAMPRPDLLPAPPAAGN